MNQKKNSEIKRRFYESNSGRIHASRKKSRNLRKNQGIKFRKNKQIREESRNQRKNQGIGLKTTTGTFFFKLMSGSANQMFDEKGN